MSEHLRDLLLDEDWHDGAAFEQPVVRAAVLRMMFGARVLSIAVVLAVAVVLSVAFHEFRQSIDAQATLLLLLAATACLGVAQQAWQLSALAPRLRDEPAAVWLAPTAQHLRRGMIYASILFIALPIVALVAVSL